MALKTSSVNDSVLLSSDVTHAAVSNATNSGVGEGLSESPSPESVPSSGLEPVIPSVTAATHLPDMDSSSVTSNVTTTEGTPELNNHNGNYSTLGLILLCTLI